MTAQSLLFLTAVFILWAAIAAAAAWLLMPDKFRRRMASLQQEGRAALDSGDEHPWMARAVWLSRPLARLGLPAEGWENSPMRIRFMNAGWRDRSAPYLFFAAKTALAILLPLLGMLYGGEGLFADGPAQVLVVLLLCA